MSIRPHERREQACPPHDAPRKTPGVGRVLARLFWVLLILLHVPGVVSTWRALQAGPFDPALLIRCLGMSLSTVYFILMVAGVPALRLEPGWRTGVALMLVVALLHVGVIERSLSAVSDGTERETVPVLLIAGVFGGSGICARRVLRHLSRRVLAILHAGRVVHLTSHWAGQWSALNILKPLTSILPIQAPRAPPALV